MSYSWPHYWDQLCLDEGWLLSAADKIEADDDNPRFKRKGVSRDDLALAFVKREAKKGSERHKTALWYHENREEDDK